MRTATMNDTCIQLGSPARLEKGQRVRVKRATNQPGYLEHDKWFARPLGRGKDSMMVLGSDFTLVK